MTILYADDRPSPELVDELNNFENVSYVRSLSGLTTFIKTHGHPHVLVMDILIPQEDESLPDHFNRGLDPALEYKLRFPEMVLVFVTNEPKLIHIMYLEQRISKDKLKRIGYFSKVSKAKLVPLITFLQAGNTNHLAKDDILPSDYSKMKANIRRLLTVEEETILKYISLGLSYDDIKFKTSLNVNGLLTGIRDKLKGQYKLQLFDPLINEKNSGDGLQFLSHLAVFLELSMLEFSVIDKMRKRE